jgi:hypothetical protein
MEKKIITEGMEVHKEWYEQAGKQTLETLPKFLNDLMNNYYHDYGTICHAIAAGGLATMYAMNETPQGGITGFQSGAVMWEFIKNWNYTDNKLGLKIIDYDNLLYPQYQDKFKSTITHKTWKLLQREASKMLQKEKSFHPNVKKHLENICAGELPFGLTIAKD